MLRKQRKAEHYGSKSWGEGPEAPLFAHGGPNHPGQYLFKRPSKQVTFGNSNFLSDMGVCECKKSTKYRLIAHKEILYICFSTDKIIGILDYQWHEQNQANDLGNQVFTEIRASSEHVIYTGNFFVWRFFKVSQTCSPFTVVWEPVP